MTLLTDGLDNVAGSTGRAGPCSDSDLLGGVVRYTRTIKADVHLSCRLVAHKLPKCHGIECDGVSYTLMPHCHASHLPRNHA